MKAMPLGPSLLPEFDHETSTLRKVLERVPFERREFRPHPKSMTMLALSAHLVDLIDWAAQTMKSSGVDIDTVPTPVVPASREELLQSFESHLANTRSALAEAGDAAYLENWTLSKGGAVMFSMPRIAVIRTMILNHLVHHRGQLSVYLRMNDVPVPAMYGPSADEA